MALGESLYWSEEFSGLMDGAKIEIYYPSAHLFTKWPPPTVHTPSDGLQTPASTCSFNHFPSQTQPPLAVHRVMMFLPHFHPLPNYPPAPRPHIHFLSTPLSSAGACIKAEHRVWVAAAIGLFLWFSFHMVTARPPARSLKVQWPSLSSLSSRVIHHLMKTPVFKSFFPEMTLWLASLICLISGLPNIFCCTWRTLWQFSINLWFPCKCEIFFLDLSAYYVPLRIREWNLEHRTSRISGVAGSGIKRLITWRSDAPSDISASSGWAIINPDKRLNYLLGGINMWNKS